MSTATPGVSPAVDEKLSWFTRICYGFGDTACNVVAGAMTILTFFYTDYAGVEPTTVGLVMLLSRCFDGVSDVIMGFIVERTNSKWGKSRPWVLWSSILSAFRLFLFTACRKAFRTLRSSFICSLLTTSATRFVIPR